MVTELDTTSSGVKCCLCDANLCLQRRKEEGKERNDGSTADVLEHRLLSSV